MTKDDDKWEKTLENIPDLEDLKNISSKRIRNETIENIKEVENLDGSDTKVNMNRDELLDNISSFEVVEEESAEVVNSDNESLRRNTLENLSDLKDLNTLDHAEDNEKDRKVDLRETVHGAVASDIEGPFLDDDFLEDEEPSVEEDAKQEIYYAGFWLRFFAFTIDISLITIFFSLVLKFLTPGLLRSLQPNLINSIENFLGVLSGNQIFITDIFSNVISYSLLLSFLALISSLTVGIAYFSVLESSDFKGTLGKLIVGIQVVGAEQKKISLLRSLARYISKLISITAFGLGLVSIALDFKKRAAHDFINGSYVVKRPGYSFSQGFFGFSLAVLCLLLAPLLNGKVQFDHPKLVVKTDPNESRQIKKLEKSLIDIEKELSKQKKQTIEKVIKDFPEKTRQQNTYVSIEDISKGEKKNSYKKDPLAKIKERAKLPKAPIFDYVSGAINIAGQTLSAKSLVARSSSDEGTLKLYFYDRKLSKSQKRSIQAPTGAILNINFLLRKPLPNCSRSNIVGYIGRVLVKGAGISSDFRSSSSINSYSLTCDKEGRISGRIANVATIKNRGKNYPLSFDFNINSLIKK